MKLHEKVASTWLRRIVLAAFSPDFYRQIGIQRFRHPETGNHVLFYSLPQEEQKRIHDQWQAKKAPHTREISRADAAHLQKEMRRSEREKNEAEAKAGQADRREMAKALKELKSKNLPKRLFDKEKRRLVQEMESRALAREKERKKQQADAA
jgi:hypothetical protein